MRNIVEYWKKVKEDFAKFYTEKRREGLATDAILARFAFQTGLRQITLRKWLSELNRSGLLEEFDKPTIITCPVCGAEYSSRLGSCPACAEKELKKYEMLVEKQKQEQEKQRQIEELEGKISKVKNTIEILNRCKKRHIDEGQTELAERDDKELQENTQELQKLQEELSKLKENDLFKKVIS